MTIDFELGKLEEIKKNLDVAVFNFSIAGEIVCEVSLEVPSETKIMALKKMAIDSFSAGYKNEIDLTSVNFNFRS